MRSNKIHFHLILTHFFLFCDQVLFLLTRSTDHTENGGGKTFWKQVLDKDNQLVRGASYVDSYVSLSVCRLLDTLRPTVARGLFTARRHTKTSLHTAERALSSALTPEGCVWAVLRHSGPADSSPGSSLHWPWPLTKPKRFPQNNLTQNRQVPKSYDWLS